MKQHVAVGQTDYTVLVLIRTTAGAPSTGLTEASIDIAYARVETDNDVTTADVTPAALAALTTAHTDWGFEEVSATDHPGLYRLDIADAVFASGAWSAVVSVTGTGLDPCQVEFVLVPVSPLTGVQLAPVTHTSATIPTVTTTGTATAVTTVNGLAANVITATSIASDAITAAKIAAGAIDAATFAADVDAEILSYLVDDATRIDASALNTASVTSIPAILVDTGTTLDGKLDTIDNFVDTEVAAILAAVDTEIGAVKTVVDAILADTGTDGVVVAAASKSGYALSSAGLADFFDTDSGTDYASAVAGSVVKEIADNAGGSALTEAGIADAVWDEAQSGHTTAGTFGKYLDEEVSGIAAGSGPTADEIADEVQTRTITAVTTVASVTALGAQAKADVNAEVVDALATDTYAEPGQGAPAATASLSAKLGYLYKAWRNKKTQTEDTFTLFADDASTADQKATVSDDDTTFTHGEMGTGA